MVWRSPNDARIITETLQFEQTDIQGGTPMAQKQGAGSGAGQLNSAEATFYASVDAAEAAKQVALKAATTAAAGRMANITFHTAVVNAANIAIASGMPASHLGRASRLALQMGEAGLT
jgi:hypothetical protein